MRVVRLFLSGEYEDAHIYMSRLVAIASNRSIEFYDIKQIASALDSQIFTGQSLFSLMFDRSDQLIQYTSSKNSTRQGERHYLSQYFDRIPDEIIDIGSIASTPQTETLHCDYSVLLDAMIYQKRLYIGSDDGFYHVDIGWEEGASISLGATVKRTDARCIATTAKYGAVNASCGDQGLFSAVDDFGWMRQFEGLGVLEQVAPVSQKSYWSSDGFINYASQVQASIFQTPKQRYEQQELLYEKESEVITEIRSTGLKLDQTFELLRSRFNFDSSNVQFTYNSNENLFIHGYDGRFFIAGLQSTGVVSRYRVREYSKLDERIISMSPSPYGVVIETDDHVYLFADGAFVPLIDRDVLSVRTFPRATRHYGVITVTTEDGIFLIGLFDDSGKPRPRRPIRRRSG